MKIDDPLDPTAQAVRAWIDEEGGPLAPSGLPRLLRNEDFLHAMVSVDYLQQALNRSSTDNGGPEVSVHITRSPGMRCAIRLVTPTHAAVMVPAGTLARLQVMHRLLLGYWARGEASPTILASIKDRPFERHPPRALLPLIDDLPPPAGAGPWHGLDALNDAIELDAAFAPDVGELNHLALSLLLSHEFAHVARHHPELLRRVAAGELAFEVDSGAERRPGTRAELRRAMENDADRVAAYLVVLTLVRQVAGQPETLPRGFVRLGYAVTALLALFDPRRLSLMHFGAEASYPHPLVRHDGYLDDGTTCAEGLGCGDAFSANALYGARKCLDALRLLEYDIYARRRFCVEDEHVEPVIHAMRGSTLDMLTLARERERQNALTLRLNTLISDTYGSFRF